MCPVSPYCFNIMTCLPLENCQTALLHQPCPQWWDHDSWLQTKCAGLHDTEITIWQTNIPIPPCICWHHSFCQIFNTIASKYSLQMFWHFVCEWWQARRYYQLLLVPGACLLGNCCPRRGICLLQKHHFENHQPFAQGTMLQHCCFCWQHCANPPPHGLPDLVPAMLGAKSNTSLAKYVLLLDYDPHQ